MELHFFAIPTLDPGAAQDGFNRFCARHRVTAVERQFVPAGADSHWALCVAVAQAQPPLPAALKAGAAAPRAGKVDCKLVLGEADFALYAELRKLRKLCKRVAEQAGLPVYAVFTNEQLAAMAQQRTTTAAALGAVDGVGAARVQACASAFGEQLFCRSRDDAQAVLHGYALLLAQRRRLQLKPGAQPRRSEGGLACCGVRVRRGVVLPSARKQARYRSGLRRLRHAETNAAAGEADLLRAHEALLAALARTHTLQWRQRLCHGALPMRWVGWPRQVQR